MSINELSGLTTLEAPGGSSGFEVHSHELALSGNSLPAGTGTLTPLGVACGSRLRSPTAIHWGGALCPNLPAVDWPPLQDSAGSGDISDMSVTSRRGLGLLSACFFIQVPAVFRKQLNLWISYGQFACFTVLSEALSLKFSPVSAVRLGRHFLHLLSWPWAPQVAISEFFDSLSITFQVDSSVSHRDKP